MATLAPAPDYQPDDTDDSDFRSLCAAYLPDDEPPF